jgi:PAS domain S-box-containing protein
MTTIAWITLFLSMGLAVWSAYQYQNSRQQRKRLQTALDEAKLKIDQLEQVHLKKEIQRKGTEEKLRSYLQLLDALINAIPNPIYYKNEQGVFQGCNVVFAETILGLTRDHIIGKRAQALSDQIPPDLAATYQREEMNALRKGSCLTHEAQVRCADGRHRDFLFTLAPIKNRQGQAIGSVSVLADLTERNRAAEDRLEKKKLEGVLETAGGVCHEFNQPVQALSGFLEIMALKTETDTDSLEYIHKAMAQIERMGDITAKLQRITHYETMAYADKTRIIDIHKSSQ